MIMASLNAFNLDSGKYVVFNALLQLIIYVKEKNAILFTYPLAVCFSFEQHLDNDTILNWM